MIANSSERVLAVLDVFQTKLISAASRSSRSTPARSPSPSRRARSTASRPSSRRASSSETAKKVAKIIRDEGPKGVKTQIQGDELRVIGKSRDDLQAVIALLKGADVDADLQFTNYR